MKVLSISRILNFAWISSTSRNVLKLLIISPFWFLKIISSTSTLQPFSSLTEKKDSWESNKFYLFQKHLLSSSRLNWNRFRESINSRGINIIPVENSNLKKIFSRFKDSYQQRKFQLNRYLLFLVFPIMAFLSVYVCFTFFYSLFHFVRCLEILFSRGNISSHVHI